jgi:N-acetylmuramic acid 6-phosphate etherase
MISTGAMVRMGRVYSNFMVNMHVKNKKLSQRGILILKSLAQVDRAVALEALEKAGMSIPLALVMLKTSTTKAESTRRLRKAKGNVRKAIEA